MAQEIKIIDTKISFTNDIFFKYSLSGEDQKSQELRLGIIRSLIPQDFKEVKVINPEITADVLQGKGVRLDILLQDTNNLELINIEMQVSKYKSNEAKRFQFYGSRLVVNQIERGNEYKKLVKVYQIIFIDDVIEEEFICYYQSKSQNNKIEKDNLVTRIYVCLPYINKLVKEKGVEALNDFEKVCYLFKNNINNDILQVTDKVEGTDNTTMDKHEEFPMTKILIDKYNEFPKETKLWSWAQAIEDGARYYDSKMSESYEEGVEEGTIQGKEKERIVMAKRLVSKKYQMEDVSWLDTLTSKQVDAIFDYVLEIDDVIVFKQKIIEV